jgi:hypothetical protein
MMITKLNSEEKLALTGVIKWVISADNENTIEGIEEFFKQNEWGDFNAIWDEMDTRFDSIEDLKEFLTSITRQEAREIIIQIAKDIMMSDVIITYEEKQVLAFLNDIWG